MSLESTMGVVNPYIQGGLTAISGAVEMGQDIKGNIDYYRDMDTTISRPENPYDRIPSYGLTDEIKQLGTLSTDLQEGEVGKGMIGRSLLKGATTGFAAGAATMNPLGMAIGTAAGAIGGLVGGIIGKNKTIDEAEKREAELGKKISEAQASYNKETDDYYEAQNAKDMFAIREKRKAERMYNIPSFTSLY